MTQRLMHGRISDIEELLAIQCLSQLDGRVGGDEAGTWHPVMCQPRQPRVRITVIPLYVAACDDDRRIIELVHGSPCPIVWVVQQVPSTCLECR
jgi:hypothetical protein